MPVFIVLLASVIIMYLFGFKAFLWCALAGIITAIVSFLYIFLRSIGKLEKIKMFFKKIWKNYVKYETKFFHWLDN